ncbi:MAG: hypothetical protein K2L11_03595 [Muribaculaceae bacterium]|nr:hypothetical protein [Muribaculaceae bacterium]
MRKLLFLTGLSAMGLSALATDNSSDPVVFEDACAYAMSANGAYFVSEAEGGLKIVDIATGKMVVYSNDGDVGSYSQGIGKCISNTCIVVGSSADDSAVYWKDGEWYVLDVPEDAIFANHANAITSDGYRICGNIGGGGDIYNYDVLMQKPCIWTWNAEKNDYDTAVMLPFPELDFTGRIPQYVTAIDISDDGKTVIGQVMIANGLCRYPIIYTENEKGEWSYRLPDEKKLYPEGLVFPEFPGDGPVCPSQESFMTTEEIEAYTEAVLDWRDAGDYTVPYPEYEDFMTDEELKDYQKAYTEFLKEYEAWATAYSSWLDMELEILSEVPIYEFNSIRISPDGKKFANTVYVEDDSDPDAWMPDVYSYIWVFDIESRDITKYEQQDSFILTFFGNDGVALAVVGKGENPQSYVLKDGEATWMKTWITNALPECSSWMEENMTFEVMTEFWNPDINSWDVAYTEEVLTGRACATPDLSKIILGVENVWDYTDDGLSVMFDMSGADAVSVINENDVNTTIYDLSGRKLNEASAPGIYIVNGKKKVVR